MATYTGNSDSVGLRAGRLETGKLCGEPDLNTSPHGPAAYANQVRTRIRHDEYAALPDAHEDVGSSTSQPMWRVAVTRLDGPCPACGAVRSCEH